MSTNFVPLTPSHADGVLRVIILGRKSKPNLENQNESIEASMEDAESYLTRRYQGPRQIVRLGEQISGMIVDRSTLREADDLIAAGEVDVVLTEDIGRIFRNPRHMWDYAQDCCDAGVRLIAVADNIDTADEDWETAMSIAAVRHGFAVPDARRRVRRSASHSFHRGGNVQKIKFGYRKLSREEAASGLFGPVDLRIAKIADLTPVIRQICQKVMDIKKYRSYDDVAKWLNAQEISPGPYCTNKVWTDNLVASLVRDDILIGYRSLRKMLSRRVYSTGINKRRRNEAGPEKAYYAELAHLTRAEWDSLQEIVQKRAERQRGGNAKTGREHPRYDVPRGKSKFPAQHLLCGICKQLCYPASRAKYKCKCSFKDSIQKCWNHVEVDPELVRTRVLGWMLQSLEDLKPGFRAHVVDVAWSELQAIHARSGQGFESWNRQVVSLERKEAKLARAYRLTESEAILQELADVQKVLKTARKNWEASLRASEGAGRFLSRDEVDARLDEAVHILAVESFEFADFLRELLVRFEIRPIQAIDSGLVRPRAHVTLAVAMPNNGEGTPSAKEIHGVIDLFDPPVQIRHLQACVEARKVEPGKNRKPGYDKIAAALGINRMTVKRALALAKQMELEGLSEPYRELRQKPASASRWNPRPPPAND